MENRIFLLSMTAVLIVSIISCKPEKDPVGALNALVKEYGFIGFQNPMKEAGVGTLVAGRPTALSFVAHRNDCFPAENLVRHYDESNFNRSYDYTFKGNLGFLSSGTPIATVGAGMTKEYMVHVVLSGVVIEYLSSIDVTDWYIDGISNTCRNYLDQVGFIIQAIRTDNVQLQIYTSRGAQVSLEDEGVSNFFQFNSGVSWSMVDRYTVEVTTPKYIGYQLGRLRKRDNSMVLYRAVSTRDDKYLFEPISLFEADEVDNEKRFDLFEFEIKSKKFNQINIEKFENVDRHGIYIE
ncbi:MAG: hypothetical protein HN353_08640 [Bdellovibrionales bacterium]|jgi:hypothetical protein|nr:hypothetical protein [Bdellovibrionales bacterium]MBT3526889.1 hypothetical protein [Bdellovibrionales bacterium]MBT7668500.1 hypothetical protein [Bdellovibrionales bacterium]MBT7767245.1 hypothetical protein [Bdellovibrionales bacterium]